MPQKILLCTLGLSPAVVTESIDALKAQKGILPDQVIICTSKNMDIWEYGIPILREDIGEQQVICIPGADLRTAHDNLEFATQVGGLIKTLNRQNNELYVSLAGGRKSMSAIMLMLVQLYGARMVFHVLLPEEDEKGLMIKQEALFKLARDERSRYLHPKNVELVEIPFVSLFLLLNDFTAILQGRKTDASASAMQLLKSNRLVDSGGSPTENGRAILKMLSEVDSWPEPAFTTSEKKISGLNHKLSSRERNRIGTVVQRLASIQYITEINGGEWDRSRKGVHIDADNSLRVYLKDSEKGICLILGTTAQTKGQSEKLKGMVEKMLDGLLK